MAQFRVLSVLEIKNFNKNFLKYFVKQIICIVLEISNRPPVSLAVCIHEKYLLIVGIESRGDEILRPSRPALGSTQPPIQWVPGLSRR